MSATPRPVRRVGHKGAAALVTGNTLESFRRAAELGVDTIELDVLWTADGDPRVLPPAERTPLVVAHDWPDAARRTPLTLAEALDAFADPPLAHLEIDLDLKLAGREEDVVTALRERDLVERAMTSTMEVSSVRALATLAPELRRGWTLPKTRRDWPRVRWAKPLLGAAMASLRARLPGIVRRGAPALGASFVWIYHPLITPRLIEAAHAVGCELIAWTVDDAARIEHLLALGVDGICTNDPRLLPSLGAAAAR